MSEEIFYKLLEENGFGNEFKPYYKFWDNNDIQIDGDLTFNDVRTLFIAMSAMQPKEQND